MGDQHSSHTGSLQRRVPPALEKARHSLGKVLQEGVDTEKHRANTAFVALSFLDEDLCGLTYSLKLVFESRFALLGSPNANGQLRPECLPLDATLAAKEALDAIDDLASILWDDFQFAVKG